MNINKYYIFLYVWAVLAIGLGILFTVFNKQVTAFNSRICERLAAKPRLAFLKNTAERMKDPLNRIVSFAVGVAFIVIGIGILLN